MLYFNRWKTIAIVAISFAGVLFALPNLFQPSQLQTLPSWMQMRMPLGLDLQGGSHLLLQMDTNELRNDQLEIADGRRARDAAQGGNRIFRPRQGRRRDPRHHPQAGSGRVGGHGAAQAHSAGFHLLPARLECRSRDHARRWQHHSPEADRARHRGAHQRRGRARRSRPSAAASTRWAPPIPPFNARARTAFCFRSPASTTPHSSRSWSARPRS